MRSGWPGLHLLAGYARCWISQAVTPLHAVSRCVITSCPQYLWRCVKKKITDQVYCFFFAVEKVVKFWHQIFTKSLNFEKACFALCQLSRNVNITITKLWTKRLSFSLKFYHADNLVVNVRCTAVFYCLYLYFIYCYFLYFIGFHWYVIIWYVHKNKQRSISNPILINSDNITGFFFTTVSTFK